MKGDIRTAQADIQCYMCKKIIKVRHNYTWIHLMHKNAKGNDIDRPVRVCPECAEGLE